MISPAPFSWLQSLPISVMQWFNQLVSQVNGALTNIANLMNAPPVVYPWLVDIDVFDTPGSQTNWNTITYSAVVYGGFLASSGAQNASLSWPVVLGAGTWTFSEIIETGNNQGIYAIAIDGNSVGTIDGYSASGANNVVKTITGITVSTTGKHTLSITMATKNASSSGYQGALQHVRMIRTA